MKKKILSLTLALSMLIAQSSASISRDIAYNTQDISSQVIMPLSSDPGLPPPL